MQCICHYGSNHLQVHTFPVSVASRTSNFINDIVIDLSDPDDKFGYISEAGDGKIIVYSFAQDRSWSVEHSSFKVDPMVSQVDLSFTN